MPIRPELRKYYRGPAWEATRKRILERSGGKFNERGNYIGGARCESCGVPDRKYASRAQGWWLRSAELCLNCMVRQDFRNSSRPCHCEGYWISPTGVEGPPASHFPLVVRRIVMICLTVAHLDHTAGHDDDANLKALCQWCHLNYDKVHHHETRAARKDSQRPLLQASACA